MLWMFKRISWVITSVQEVAVLLPLVCLPHLWLYACMYTREGLYWYRFVHGKAESRICFASYSYIIHNGMDEIANKAHNTFCVTVFYVKQKMLRQNSCSKWSSKKSIQPKLISGVVLWWSAWDLLADYLRNNSLYGVPVSLMWVKLNLAPSFISQENIKPKV